MTLIFISRLLIGIYFLVVILGMIRLLSLSASAEKLEWPSIKAVLLWPLLILTEKGRASLNKALSPAKNPK